MHNRCNVCARGRACPDRFDLWGTNCFSDSSFPECFIKVIFMIFGCRTPDLGQELQFLKLVQPDFCDYHSKIEC